MVLSVALLSTQLHLHSPVKGKDVIHRDLAGRNILVRAANASPVFSM